eukprot:4794288-Prymnesium_polylepis.1
MMTCTCSSRRQSSEAIIYGVTQIALFRQPSRKGRNLPISVVRWTSTTFPGCSNADDGQS